MTPNRCKPLATIESAQDGRSRFGLPVSYWPKWRNWQTR